MKYLIALILLTTTTYAEDTDTLLHPVAHGAGSYALTHMGEVVCKKVTGLGTLSCTIISAAVATSVGVAVEMTQDQTEGNWKRGLAYDITGVALAIGVINLDF